MKKVLTIKEYKRMVNEEQKAKYKCKKCGRKILIPYNVDKELCTWCGTYVFKNDQEEFKYRIKEYIK